MFRNYYGIFYCDEFKKAQDFELWDRLYSEKMKISVIKKPLVKYRYHSGQISNMNVNSQTYYANIIRIRSLERLDIELSTVEKNTYIQFLSGHKLEFCEDAILVDKVLDSIYCMNKKKRYYSDTSIKKVINMERYLIVNQLEEVFPKSEIKQKIKKKIGISYKFRIEFAKLDFKKHIKSRS